MLLLSVADGNELIAKSGHVKCLLFFRCMFVPVNHGSRIASPKLDVGPEPAVKMIRIFKRTPYCYSYLLLLGV